MNSSVPALELSGVDKRFGRSEIVRGFDLRVDAGECVGLIGPNGAGKSTLFNLISGRLEPDAGEIRLWGRRIDGLRPSQINRLGLARSFQMTQVFPRLSVLDNLRCAVLWSLGYRYSIFRRLAGLRDVDARVRRMLEMIGLAHRGLAIAAELGYAEQRALEIGMTVAGDAQVVLLDEPTAGMSKSETAHFVALIRMLATGKTLLVIEHDMNVVFGLADRIAVMAEGRLVAMDTPDAVRADQAARLAYPGAVA